MRKTRLQQNSLVSRPLLKSQSRGSGDNIFQWSDSNSALLHQFYVVHGKNASAIAESFEEEGIHIPVSKIKSKLGTEGVKKKLPQWYARQFEESYF